MFLIDIRLKKCVLELLILVLFVFDSVPDQIKTQEMCDKAADDTPSPIKYVPKQYIRPKKCVIKLLMIILLH